MRPELAAWRYGDQFGRRRRKHLALTAAGITLVAGIAIAGPATGIIAGGGWGLWQGANALHGLYQARRVRTKLRLPGSDDFVPIRKKQLEQTAIVRTDDSSWGLRIRLKPLPGRSAVELRGEEALLYTGRDALRAASKLLPVVNETGARTSEVQTATQLVAEVPDPDTLFLRHANRDEPTRHVGRDMYGNPIHGRMVHALPKEIRLALEMAAHEEQERRALEGELAILEAAWREAEEVAQISDDMFLPANTDVRLRELRSADRATED